MPTYRFNGDNPKRCRYCGCVRTFSTDADAIAWGQRNCQPAPEGRCAISRDGSAIFDSAAAGREADTP